MADEKRDVRLVNKVTAEPTGWIPGLRVWKLTAYDSRNNVIAEISEDMGSNMKKMNKFVGMLEGKGYQLTGAQYKSLSNSLCLHLPWDNNIPALAEVKKYLADNS